MGEFDLNVLSILKSLILSNIVEQSNELVKICVFVLLNSIDLIAFVWSCISLLLSLSRFTIDNLPDSYPITKLFSDHQDN